VQHEVEQKFMVQLSNLEVDYCFGKHISPKKLYIPPLLDETLLVQHAYVFKLTMLPNCHATINPPINYNPCTNIWIKLANNQLLCHWLSKWLKFIGLFMAIIMGNIEDDKCFFNFGFMNNNLRNRLTTHLDLVIKMFARKFFTLNTFPFVVAMSSWTIAKSHHGVDG